MSVNSIPTPVRSHKRPWLAALLNLIPLVGLAGCAANGINHDNSLGPICFAGVIWGLGYLYLGRGFRFLLALVLPWVLGLVACAVSGYDFEHPYYRARPFSFDDALPFVVIVGLGCLITAVEAMRMAASANATLLPATQAASAVPSETAPPAG